MSRKLNVLFAIALIVTLVLPGSLPAAAAPDALVEFTVLHTNDFHGRLLPDSSGRGGAAYLAGKINEIRTEVGDENVVLVDAGDISLAAPAISQLTDGEATIDIFNRIGYEVSVFGNHEFDKGQTVLQQQVDWANFTWLGANVVLEGTDWDLPTWAEAYTVIPVGSGADQFDLGILGLAGEETPIVTLAGVTEGLVFKDLTDTILHYYDEVMATADAMIVIVHMGSEDSAEYEGLATVAQNLIDAGKPVDIMIGGHQHQDITTPILVGENEETAIVSAYYYGRKLGRLDLTYDTVSGDLDLVQFQSITINNTLTPDAAIADRIQYWADLVAPVVNAPAGYTNIPLIRDYNNQSVMGTLVAQSMLWKADDLDDGTMNNSVDIAFTNAGGLRADIDLPEGATLPYTLTWGSTFEVLPFQNTLVIMELTGEQVESLLLQSATLFKGVLQSSGITYTWSNVNGVPSVSDIAVNGVALDPTMTYTVVTNNFLAAGGDNFVDFASGQNVNDTFYDMHQALLDYIEALEDNTVDEEDLILDAVVQMRMIFMPLINREAVMP